LAFHLAALTPLILLVINNNIY